MKYTYEEISNELNNSIVIKRTDEAGEVWWIPVDEGNSDYQRYLNPDKVEHLTENPTEDVE
jgi:hypothetical protein